MRAALVLLLALCAGCAKPPAAAPEPATVQVKFESSPVGAEIVLDGRATGEKTPAALALPRMSEHQVELRLTDHQSWKGTVVAAVHGTEVRGALQPLLMVVVETDPPGASVRKGGRVVVEETPGRFAAEGGATELVVEKDGHVAARVKVALSEANRAVNVKLKRAAYVEVATAPKGAKLFVDDADSGQETPARLPVAAGESHVVQARLDALSSPPTVVKPLRPGQTAKLQLKLSDRAVEEKALKRKKLQARIRSLENEKKSAERVMKKVEFGDAEEFARQRERAAKADEQIGQAMQELAEME